MIVCGLGRLGLRVVTHLLESGYEPIVVESNWSSEHVARALRLKAPVVLGDARDPLLSPLQHPTVEFDTVLVCGLGKVGYRLVQRLYRLTPPPRLVIIHRADTATPLFKQVSRLDTVRIVLGDARDEDVLREAGIDRAYSVAAVTSDDLTNLQIALSARRLRTDVHVVLRDFSDVLAEKLGDLFGIHTTYSTSHIAGPALAAAAALGDVSQAFFAGGHLFASDTVLVHAGDRLAGQSVAMIRERDSVLVIGLRRDSQLMLLPAPDTTLAPNDEITMLATLDALARMRRVYPYRAAWPPPSLRAHHR